MSQAEINSTTSRRLFLAGAAAAAVVPSIGATAEPMPADAALVDAAACVLQLDEALEAFVDAHGDDDDYDERPEYQAMESQRAAHLDTLATVPAVGTAGLRAKARVMMFDHFARWEISWSLAEDLERVLA
ncbi:hypothetical protein [Bradyrhizobium septentrionale]|uniref:Twin-arginine translocation pathway signal n=1 Tax=Bradyrhizobium septentrionale TaxID=1404411 RepID=A0ABZ2NPG4_9BRAD